MTVIMSTVDNLLAGAFGPLTDEQTKWVKKLTHHTANLEKLLYETLNMVKAQMESSAVLEVLEKKIATPLVTPGLDYTPASHVSTSLPVSTGIVPKVLAIDDESDILDVIQEGLKMKGFETIVADNGKEGVRLALEAHPDLILLDIHLKGQNGLDVCREIKTRINTFIPIILMTGQDDLREKMSGSDNVADDLLSKPFQIEELYARVNSMHKIKTLTDELSGYRLKKSA
jgi:CheY-like chemotaxis protein